MGIGKKKMANSLAALDKNIISSKTIGRNNHANTWGYESQAEKRLQILRRK